VSESTEKNIAGELGGNTCAGQNSAIGMAEHFKNVRENALRDKKGKFHEIRGSDNLSDGYEKIALRDVNLPVPDISPGVPQILAFSSRGIAYPYIYAASIESYIIEFDGVPEIGVGDTPADAADNFEESLIDRYSADGEGLRRGFEGVS
jgi:hypothetical protein